MRQLYLLLSLLFLFVLQSCKDDELAATIPAYLKIDDISVKINDPIEGSASSKIPDAWVYINDRLIGAFELPATIPILQTGPVTVSVRGGVYNNGLSNQRVVYPFYEFYYLDTNLVPEQIYEPPIRVSYKVGSVFDQAWTGENFETGINFLTNPNSDTTINRVTTPNLVFEGNASGGIFLPVGTNFAEIYTPAFSDIPRIGTAVYMELDYKSTHDFAISIYAENRTRQFSVVNFRATNDWSKVYIDFSKVFSTLFDATDFNIAIGMVKPNSENAELLLDNIKLINF